MREMKSELLHPTDAAAGHCPVVLVGDRPELLDTERGYRLETERGYPRAKSLVRGQNGPQRTESYRAWENSQSNNLGDGCSCEIQESLRW